MTSDDMKWIASRIRDRIAANPALQKWVNERLGGITDAAPASSPASRAPASVGRVPSSTSEVQEAASEVAANVAPIARRTQALAVIRVLVAIVRADGVIDQRERVMLLEFASALGVTRDELRSIASEKPAVNIAHLPPDSADRCALLTDAFSLALVDGTIAPQERSVVEQLARALNVGLEDLNACLRAARGRYALRLEETPIPVSGGPAAAPAPTRTGDLQIVSLTCPIDMDADDQLEAEITAHISMLAECPCLVQVLASPHWGWMLLTNPAILALSTKISPDDSRIAAKTALLRLIHGTGAQLHQCEFRIVLCDVGTTWRTDFGDPTSVLRIDVKTPSRSWMRGVGVGCVTKNTDYVVWDWDE